MPAQPIAASVAPQIASAIQRAARSTGTSFQYLLTTAQIESNLNPAAQASTSSAHGLFQFIEQTWLGTLKGAGPALGYGHYANAIMQNADGRYEVPDPAARNAIMKLRSDPAASAVMAGAFTRSNSAQLTAQLGRRPNEGELYIAHFLGHEGAAKLIDVAARQPKANAADLFPGAAATNRSIFYDRAGRSRGVGEVYTVLAGRFEGARKVAAPPAAAPALRGTLVANVATRRVTPPAPDTAGVASAYADANADRPPVPDTKPLFQAMFTTRERQAVAPVVSTLWDPRNAAAPPAADKGPVRPLELFQDPGPDRRPNVRALFNGSS
jgi:hypothetical protein